MRLSKWLSVLSVLAGLAVASQAGAVVRGWYVSDSVRCAAADTIAGTRPGPGRSNGAGTFIAPYRCIRSVNSQVQPGDTVYVYSLTVADTADAYANRICPATTGTASNRITYRGYDGGGTTTGWAQDWGLHLPIPAILDTVSYVSVRGFRVKGAIEIVHQASCKNGTSDVPRSDAATNRPTADSVSYCMAQTVGIYGTNACVFYNNHIKKVTPSMAATVQLKNNGGINGTQIISSYDFYKECGQCGGVPCPGDLNPGRCVTGNYKLRFINNVVDAGTVQKGVQPKAFYIDGRSQACDIDSNQFTINFAGTGTGAGDCQGRYVRFASGNNFIGNRWTFTASDDLAGEGWVTTTLRDSSNNNLFKRDTILAGTSAPYYNFRIRLAEAGNVSNGFVGLVYDSCYYRSTRGITSSVPYRNGSIKNSLFNSFFGPALNMTGEVDELTVAQNTFFVHNLGPAVQITNLPNGKKIWLDRNIFVSDSVWAAQDATLNPPGSCSYYGSNYGLLGVPGIIDPPWFNSNRNLFYTRVGVTGGSAPNTVAYSALSTRTPASLHVANGSYADSAGDGLHCWNKVHKQDRESVIGNPVFTDTTWAALDARVAHGTPADSSIFSPGGGLPGWAGAFKPADPTTPLPDSVANLSAAATSIVGNGDAYTDLYISFDAPATAEDISVAICTDAAKLSQADFDTRMALVKAGASELGAYLYKPEGSSTHTYRRTLAGTISSIVVQVQVKDAYGNKSAFAATLTAP
jgi:hypothetical protein